MIIVIAFELFIPVVGAESVKFRRLFNGSVFATSLRPLLSINRSSSAEPELIIVKDSDWKVFWSKLGASAPMPLVDFSNEKVLVLVSKIVGPSDGHSLKVVSITTSVHGMSVLLQDHTDAIVSSDSGRVPVEILAIPISCDPINVEVKYVTDKLKHPRVVF